MFQLLCFTKIATGNSKSKNMPLNMYAYFLNFFKCNFLPSTECYSMLHSINILSTCVLSKNFRKILSVVQQANVNKKKMLTKHTCSSCEVTCKVNLSFVFQLSKPVEITGVVILWRKENSDAFYTKPNTAHGGSVYSLNGLDANTSYEIRVKIMSGRYSVESDSAFATTGEDEGV